MSGGEVIRLLNLSGVSARIIAGRIYITPAYKVTTEIRELIQTNRDALAESLEKFGLLNIVEPEARGVSYQRWIQSLPPDAFRKGLD